MARLFISYGITKSASTFAWQLIKRVAIAGGLPVATLTARSKGADTPEDYIDPVSHEKLALIRADVGEAPVVIKTHGDATPAVARLVAEGEAQVFASYRDPRDIALSLLDHGARSRRAGIADFAEYNDVVDTIEPIKSQLRRFENWVRTCDPLLIPYDEICFDTRTTVARVARCLGVTVDATALAAEFMAHKERIGQFNKGVQRRFQQEMSADISALFIDEFASHYKRYFPKEIDSVRPDDVRRIIERERAVVESAGPGDRPVTLDVEQIIRCLYRTLLGREADPKGLSSYVGTFMGGRSIEEISEHLRLSPEAISKKLCLPQKLNDQRQKNTSLKNKGISHILPPQIYFTLAQEHAYLVCRNIVTNTFDISAPAELTPAGGRTAGYKIVQFWDAKEAPRDVAHLIDEWAGSTSEGGHILFDDEAAAAFIAENYPFYFRTAYDYCFHPAMKSDYFRLAYLYINGGVYIDADDKMIRPLPALDLSSRDILLVSPIVRSRINDCIVGIEPKHWFTSLGGLDGPECYFANSPILVSKHNEIVRIALVRATNAILAAKRDGIRPRIHLTTGPTNWTLAIVASRLYAACGGAPLSDVKVIDWSQYALRQQPLAYKSDARHWANFEKQSRAMPQPPGASAGADGKTPAGAST